MTIIGIIDQSSLTRSSVIINHHRQHHNHNHRNHHNNHQSSFHQCTIYLFDIKSSLVLKRSIVNKKLELFKKSSFTVGRSHYTSHQMSF